MKEKCYLYTRVSSAKQVDGYSLDAQRERLHDYVEYKGLAIAGEYCDAGFSGHSIKGRPQFTQMLDDIVAEKDGIRWVVVFKLSRFGRNAADVLRTMQLLSDFDINLVCVDDAIDSSTPGGRLALSILSAVAEIERENIHIQLEAGRDMMLKGGGFPGGPIPFGYRKGENGLEIFKPEADIVSMIYERYLREDGSIAGVTNYFNEMGYTRRSKNGVMPYTTTFVSDILRRPVYAGKYIHNLRSATGKPVYEVKGSHEAIVSEDIWESTQKKMRDMADRYKPQKEHCSLLAGLIRCPKCGGPMVTCGGGKDINHNHGGYYKPYYSYHCSFHTKKEGVRCSFRRMFSEKRIDKAVYEVICRVDTSTEFREALSDKMAAKKSVEDCRADIKDIRRKIMILETEKRNIGRELDLLDPIDEGYSEAFSELQDKMDVLYDRIDVLEADLEEAENERELAQNDNVVSEELEWFVSDFPKVFDKMTAQERREYCRLFIDRIEVFPEKRKDGRILKSISFTIPIKSLERTSFSGTKKTASVSFSVDCGKAEITAAEANAKATYVQIKKFVRDRYGANVHSLYIAQIKTKCGLDMRKNYNISKKNGRVPNCPADKEKYIVDALKFYKVLGKDVEVMA